MQELVLQTSSRFLFAFLCCCFLGGGGTRPLKLKKSPLYSLVYTKMHNWKCIACISGMFLSLYKPNWWSRLFFVVTVSCSNGSMCYTETEKWTSNINICPDYMASTTIYHHHVYLIGYRETEALGRMNGTTVTSLRGVNFNFCLSRLLDTILYSSAECGHNSNTVK